MNLTVFSRFLKWVEEKISYGSLPPWLRIVLQLLTGIVLMYFTEREIQDPDIQFIAELGIVGITTLSLIITIGFQTDIRWYITKSLLRGISRSRGRVITNVDFTMTPVIDTLLPGAVIEINFKVGGRLLFGEIQPTEYIPLLAMDPALFHGNAGIGKWSGTGAKCEDDVERATWQISGRVILNTHRIREDVPQEIDRASLFLMLQEHGNGHHLCNWCLGHLSVDIPTTTETLHALIRLGVFKKLPPGYSVLAIDSEHNYHSNLVFLARKFREMQRSRREEDRKKREQCDQLEAAIRHFLHRELERLSNDYNLESVSPYVPQEGSYEEELNDSSFSKRLLKDMPQPRTGRSGRPNTSVLVAVYQTPEFASHVNQGHGICLFGFSDQSPGEARIRVIFDLCQLHEEGDAPWRLTEEDLRILATPSSESDFETYTPLLRERLTSSPQELELPPLDDVLLPDDRLYASLSKLGSLARASLRIGIFVNSAPSVTPYWINLRLFEGALSRIMEQPSQQAQDLQAHLEEAINIVVNRCVRAYDIDDERTRLLNCCSEHSYAARELPSLWEFKHPGIPTCPIGIDEETGEVAFPPEDMGISSPSERVRCSVILLVPFDSYTRMIECVIRKVEEFHHNVVCIITLFSTADEWDYLSPSKVVDIIPLYRVDPELTAREALQPLPLLDDYRRLRPWLFEEADD